MHLAIQNVLKIFYTILSVIGVPVNLMAIVILSQGKCGLSLCTTQYLVGMAAADLMVIITEVILRQLNHYYFRGSFLDITPVCCVNYVLFRAARDCSVWFTVTFSFDRFVLICCQKLKTKYCTKKNANFVLIITFILFSLKNIPFYFVFEPALITLNAQFFCFPKLDYYTQPEWVGFHWFDKILTPLMPFVLIMLFNALTIRHVLIVSRVRKRLKYRSEVRNQSDQEMESRRKSMILLFAISSSFVLLWSVNVIEFLYYDISGAKRDYDNNSLLIFRKVGSMLQNLSSCTNTFIYGITQPTFRGQFRSVVKYALTSFCRLTNNK